MEAEASPFSPPPPPTLKDCGVLGALEEEGSFKVCVGVVCGCVSTCTCMCVHVSSCMCVCACVCACVCVRIWNTGEA